MRKIGARLLAFLVVAAASFALWSGLALAGSSAMNAGGGEDTSTSVFGSSSRGRLIQTQEETPDAEETPGRHNCRRGQNGGDSNDGEQESTETSTAV